MAHHELNCQKLICENSGKEDGLRFVLEVNENGSTETLDSLKKGSKVVGKVKLAEKIVRDGITIEEGIYFIISVHAILGLPFAPESHDFLTYVRSYFMGGISEKLTARVITFHKSIEV